MCYDLSTKCLNILYKQVIRKLYRYLPYQMKKKNTGKSQYLHKASSMPKLSIGVDDFLIRLKTVTAAGAEHVVQRHCCNAANVQQSFIKKVSTFNTTQCSRYNTELNYNGLSNTLVSLTYSSCELLGRSIEQTGKCIEVLIQTKINYILF